MQDLIDQQEKDRGDDAEYEHHRRGMARLPRAAMQTLGITEGDIVQLSGKRATAAIAMAAYDEDQALSVVRLDGLQRANAEVGSGEHVSRSTAVIEEIVLISETASAPPLFAARAG